jgi:acyl carrier protein
MAAELTQIEEKIFEYVGNNSHSDIKKISNHTMLFKEGVFDSMAFVLLIDYIEQTFGIKAGDEDLVEENFESIEAISKYVQRKKEVHVS